MFCSEEKTQKATSKGYPTPQKKAVLLKNCSNILNSRNDNSIRLPSGEEKPPELPFNRLSFLVLQTKRKLSYYLLPLFSVALVVGRLSVGKKHTLLQAWLCVSALCGLQMCVLVRWIIVLLFLLLHLSNLKNSCVRHFVSNNRFQIYLKIERSYQTRFPTKNYLQNAMCLISCC